MNIDRSALAETARHDGELRIAGRYLDADIDIEIDGAVTRFAFRDGAVVEIGDGSTADDVPRIVLSGAADHWQKVLAAAPAAYYQDVLFGSLFSLNGITVTGPPLDVLYPYYRTVQRVVGLVREHVSGPSPVAATAAPVGRKFDAAVGRYVYVDVDGVQYRVYYEESGAGVPMLLQHTAGADGRQYRHMLEDPELQAEYRMIAYDLPLHGKSNPPAGERWWEAEYVLTQDFLLAFVVAFSETLELDRPVFLGCSIGGSLAPDIALTHPDRFRHVVAINASVRGGGVDRHDVMHRSWDDPRINAEWLGQWMYGHTSALAPEVYRRENGWYYSQGAPGVLRGDLHFYQVDHDLEGKLSEIDTSRCGVDIIVGESDPAGLSDTTGAKGLADGIEGSTFHRVAGLAHFMMSEDPDRFLPMIRPILQRIARRVPAHEGA